jgi:RNA polymerase sigma-70 factor (ECF subfamily)
VEDQVRAAQRGDPRAMHALIAELQSWVGAIVAPIALDRADDALQETFIAVFRNLPALREPAALRGWVRRIAVREAVRAASGRREVSLDTMVIDVSAPTAVDVDDRLDVEEVLAALPPEQRAVLVLRHVEDLSEDEVAAVLRIPPGTVKSRLHRARTMFMRRWAS